MDQSAGPITITKDTKTISDWIVLSKRSPQDYNEYTKLQATVKDKFNDDTFKPVDESISKNPQSYKKALNSTWKRSDEIFDGKFFLFQDGITATDINQGTLSDCYFLSTLSSLAHVSQTHIRKIFVSPKVNKYGFYGVWLCHDGEWRQVVVDDWFPCKNKQPLFSRANGNEVWVLLLEKAFAKTYGTYDKIEIGFSQAAHRDLTGAPAVFYNRKDESPEEADRQFKIIEKAISNKFVVTTSSRASSEGLESENENGVVSSHCYAVLGTARVQDKNGQSVELLQLRNPWGKKEWQGAWSDDSEEWTPELKEQLKVVVANDGIFWISALDYVKEFTSTTVGYIYPDYVYSSFRFDEIPKNEAHTVRLAKVINKYAGNHVFITATQTDKRTFQKQKVDYKYSLIKVVVFQYDPATKKPIKFIEASGSAERDVFVDTLLDEGEYSVYVETEWEQNLSRNLVLSTFSDKPVTIDDLEVHHDHATQYLEEQVRAHSQTGKGVKVQDYKHDIKRVQGSFAGIIYFYYQNPTDSWTLSEEFTMKNYKNLAVYAPRTNVDVNVVEVPPNTNRSLIFKIAKTGGFSYSFSTTYTIKN